MWVKPAQTCCSIPNYFNSYPVFILCVGLREVFTAPLLIWLTQWDICITRWSIQLLVAVYLKQRPPSGLLAIGILSFFTLFPQLRGHTTLSLSTEPSPMGRGLFSESQSTPRDLGSHKHKAGLKISVITTSLFLFQEKAGGFKQKIQGKNP